MGMVIKKTDGQIRLDVLEELKGDARVPDTDVGVDVEIGVVTLTGALDSGVASMAAQLAAHRVGSSRRGEQHRRERAGTP
jgi:osmotically-inducible protein OsmY